MLGVFCWLGCKESGEDTAGLVGFTGVGAHGVLGREVTVTFDGESHEATECLDLGDADIADFGEAESQVTESDGGGSLATMLALNSAEYWRLAKCLVNHAEGPRGAVRRSVGASWGLARMTRITTPSLGRQPDRHGSNPFPRSDGHGA